MSKTYKEFQTEQNKEESNVSFKTTISVDFTIPSVYEDKYKELIKSSKFKNEMSKYSDKLIQDTLSNTTSGGTMWFDDIKTTIDKIK